MKALKCKTLGACGMGFMWVQSIMVEGIWIMQIQNNGDLLLRQFLLVANIMVPWQLYY